MTPESVIEPEFELVWDESPKRVEPWQCYPVNYTYDTSPVPVVIESKD